MDGTAGRRLAPSRSLAMTVDDADVIGASKSLNRELAGNNDF
jgi:hypothetical protein